MTRLLATSDWHIGAGAAYPGRLEDQARVADRIADIAIERGVDGVLHAGDVLDGPAVLPEHLAVFATFLRKMETHGIPVLVALGNGRHDQSLRATSGLAIFDHFENCTVAATPGVYAFAGCSVAVLPWVHPGRLIARTGRDVPRDEVNTIAADLLVDVARDLRQECVSPCILLGHWSVSGAALPAGLPVDQLREPVLPIDALEDLGYDALVFGHIHRGQSLGTTGLYTGSPMPLNFGEGHLEHGVWILDTDMLVEGARFVPINSPRFITIDYDHDGPVNVVTTDFDLRGAIVRYRYTATAEEQRHIDVSELRASLLAAGARSVKVEPQIVREQRARVVGVDEQLGEMAALEMWLQAVGYDGDQDALRDRARDLLETVA